MTLNSYFTLNSGYPDGVNYFTLCLLTELIVRWGHGWLPIHIAVRSDVAESAFCSVSA